MIYLFDQYSIILVTNFDIMELLVSLLILQSWPDERFYVFLLVNRNAHSPFEPTHLGESGVQYGYQADFALQHFRRIRLCPC